MSTDPDGANALDIEQAVAALLDSTRVDDKPEAAEAEPDPEAGAPGEAAAEDGAEGDTDEGEAEAEAEEPGIEVDLPDGKRRLTQAEIREGLMLKADYTRKTMEVADRRRQVDAEAAEYSRMREQLSEALQTWAVPTEQEPDWEALVAKDPVAAFKAKVQWDKRQAKAKEAANAWRQMREGEQQRAIAAERQKLLEYVPEWADPATAESGVRDMVAAAGAYGFTPEDIAGIVDHRVLRALKDVAAYRALQAKKPAVEKRVAAAPPALKPGAKPPKQDSEKTVARRKLQAELKRTGSDKAAMALLMLDLGA